MSVAANFSPPKFPRQHNNLKRGLKLRPALYAQTPTGLGDSKIISPAFSQEPQLRD